MLLLCLPIRKRETRSPLIRPRLPTNLPMATRKQDTPEPNRRHYRVSQHSHRKRSLSIKRIPGISIKGADSLEQRGNHERGDGVWRLWI